MSDYNETPKKTAGEILKETREAKGFSLRAIHETTKIPLDVLKAIEEGYSVRTLSSFYLKGFVKMYAEYLGIDVSEFLEQPLSVLQKSEKSEEPKITKVREKQYHIHEDDFDLSRWINEDQQRMIVKIVGGILVLLLMIRLVGCFMPKKTEQRAEAVKNTPVISPKKIAEEKIVSPKKISPAPEKSKDSSKPVEQKSEEPAESKPETQKVRLTIKALKGGWLQVKVDGTVVMESTVKSGAVETWEADREIVISGRTIHNLEFELNGKMIGKLGHQDRNARRVLITKKGLAVKG